MVLREVKMTSHKKLKHKQGCSASVQILLIEA